MKIIPLNPFTFCPIQSEGVFLLPLTTEYTTYLLHSFCRRKNGKPRERTFFQDSDDTVQPVSKAKTGRSNNDTYVQSQVER